MCADAATVGMEEPERDCYPCQIQGKNAAPKSKTIPEMTQKFALKSSLRAAAIALIAFSLCSMAMASGHNGTTPLPQTARQADGDTIKKAPSFKGKYRNEEFRVYIIIDIDSQSVVVPGQEFLGEMAGYLGAERDTRLWYFTSAERNGKNKASLNITNDYGSEDLEATLTLRADGSIVLKQGSGSRIKIVVDRKWQKLPSELVFKPVGKKR